MLGAKLPQVGTGSVSSDELGDVSFTGEVSGHAWPLESVPNNLKVRLAVTTVSLRPVARQIHV